MSPTHPLAGRRILFVLCGFDLGGAERQALYLAKHLKEAGADVCIWGHHHKYPGPERVISQCESTGIPLAEYKFRWPCGKAALIRDAFRLLIGLHKVRPDLILAYTTWPNIGCGLVWRWSPAKAFVWGQRDLAPIKNNWIERRAYQRASAIICNAAHEVRHLTQALCKPSVPMHVVHNGIELDQPKWSRSQWRSKLRCSEDAILVTMLANLRTDKDHATMLLAWRKIVDSAPVTSKIKLCLAGAPQEGADAVETMLTSLHLEDNVLLPGQISDVSGFLAACDIGVLSSSAEGLANSILEYMACGLPVVATDIDGNREALGDDSDVQLFRKNDPENLAKKLLCMIESPDLRHSLGIRNGKRAMREFSIQTMCGRMSTIILDILSTCHR